MQSRLEEEIKVVQLESWPTEIRETTMFGGVEVASEREEGTDGLVDQRQARKIDGKNEDRHSCAV